MRRHPILVGALLQLGPIVTIAATFVAPRLAAQSATPAPLPAPAIAGAIVPSASLRVRGEQWDWFGSDPAGSYGFVGALLRVGLSQARPTTSWNIELAAPALLGLPNDAIAPAPRGQLGLGGTYYAANDQAGIPVSVFLKQAWVRFGRPPSRGEIGRAHV